MLELQGKKKYDLEDRTLAFAKDTIRFVNKVPKTLPNLEIAKQLDTFFRFSRGTIT